MGIEAAFIEAALRGYGCRLNINTANAVPGFTDFERHTSKAFTHAWFMDGGPTGGQPRHSVQAQQGYIEAPSQPTQQPSTEPPQQASTEPPSQSAHRLQAQQVDVGKLCVVLTGHYELCVQGFGLGFRANKVWLGEYLCRVTV